MNEKRMHESRINNSIQPNENRIAYRVWKCHTEQRQLCDTTTNKWKLNNSNNHKKDRMEQSDGGYCAKCTEEYEIRIKKRKIENEEVLKATKGWQRN